MIDSDALNKKIDILNNRFERDNGQSYIAFIGWYWREVDFNQKIWLGDCGTYVGFMESNKWNYPNWPVTDEQDALMKSMLAAIDLLADETTIEASLEAFFDFLQTCTGEKSRKEIRDEAIEAVDAMGPTLESMMGRPTKIPLD